MSVEGIKWNTEKYLNHSKKKRKEKKGHRTSRWDTDKTTTKMMTNPNIEINTLNVSVLNMPVKKQRFSYLTSNRREREKRQKRKRVKTRRENEYVDQMDHLFVHDENGAQ